MTVYPARLVIDLELTTEEDTGLLDGMLADVAKLIGDNNYGGSGDIVDSWDARIEDPRETFRIVAAGNAVDGFRFFRPVPDQLDGGEINEDFDDEDWCTADVQPYPNDRWVPLPDDF